MKYFIYELFEPDGITCRYVGVTKDMKQRYNVHLTVKNKKTHCYYWIRSLLAKNELPIMKLIEEIEEEQIDEKEVYWIAKRKSEGFNLTNHAIGGRVNRGWKRTSEAIEKTRLANKGRKRTSEVIEKMRLAQQGRKRTSEVIEKMRLAQLGKKHSSETREKLRLANKGRKRTSEVKEKMRLSHLGKKFTPEHKEKIGNAQQGKKNSNAKLTEFQVREILASDESHASLGRKYNITRNAIFEIKKGKRWKHLHKEGEPITTALPANNAVEIPPPLVNIKS